MGVSENGGCSPNGHWGSLKNSDDPSELGVLYVQTSHMSSVQNHCWLMNEYNREFYYPI